jgi:hypothetical protein
MCGSATQTVLRCAAYHFVMELHDVLLRVVYDGLDDRVEQGLDRKRMSVRKLAQTAGLHYPNVAAIFRGKPAAESTWQKLFDVAYPSILLEEGDGS